MFFSIIDFLCISHLLFVIGLWGVFVVRRHLIIVLISLEVILFALNLNFIFFSVYLDDFIGQILALMVLTIAAAESAIGLALLVIYYRLRGVIDIDYINYLKG